MENNIVLLLGGNIGDSRGYIRNAYALLEQQLGYASHISSFYQTKSWGFQADDFINLAMVIPTQVEAEKCLQIAKDIEEELGRIDQKTEQAYASREIDIDIIFYGKQIVNTPHLIIPHPKMQDRNFVLQPLNEIIADFTHPILRKTIATLTEECADKEPAIRLHEQV